MSEEFTGLAYGIGVTFGSVTYNMALINNGLFECGFNTGGRMYIMGHRVTLTGAYGALRKARNAKRYQARFNRRAGGNGAK